MRALIHAPLVQALGLPVFAQESEDITKMGYQL